MARKRQAQRCTATRKRDGQPCGNWALHGSTVCKFHGGNTPQAKAKAKQRIVEQQITGALGRLKVVPVADPLTALAELAGEILAWKELAATKVAELKALSEANPLSGSDEVRASVEVFERALDRAVTVLTAIARLNIDERLTAIREEQARVVKEALLGALADTGLDTVKQREAAGHLARRLRLVAS